MTIVRLTAHALAAARAVDPAVVPAAVHAAVEVAVFEQLREIAHCRPAQIEDRIAAIREDIGEFRLPRSPMTAW